MPEAAPKPGPHLKPYGRIIEALTGDGPPASRRPHRLLDALIAFAQHRLRILAASLAE